MVAQQVNIAPGRDPKRGLGIRQLAPFLVALLTSAAFLPVLRNDFVLIDDDWTFLANPYYRGLGWTQLEWMWSTTYLAMYRPLTWMTYGTDYVLWALNPFGYHLTSLVLHVLTAVVFYFVMLRLLVFANWERKVELLGPSVSAAIAALVFAIHPLRVEPVAWASARADVLSGLFFVLCILSYLKAAASSDEWSHSSSWRAVSVACYVLSLLSKPVALGLPLILIVLDVYPLRRLTHVDWSLAGRRVWWEKVPFILCALAAAPIALLAKAEAGTVVSLSNVLVALYVPAFYLWKLLVPLGLTQYERPLILQLSVWRFLVYCATVPVMTLVLLGARRRWPAGLAVWVCYLVLLVPTLGIVRYGPQIAADRYTYLPSLGWATLAGAGGLACWRAWRSRRIGLPGVSLAGAVAVAALLALATLTWKQAQVWHDTERFMNHVLASHPDSFAAHNNLGMALLEHDRLDEAIEHFKRALQLRPDSADVNNNWGVILVRQGGLDEARRYFGRAVELAPQHAGAHGNLGGVLARQGKRDEAIDHLLTALRLNPNLPDAQRNLEAVLGWSRPRVSPQ
jgi:hypothetical protein